MVECTEHESPGPLHADMNPSPETSRSPSTNDAVAPSAPGLVVRIPGPLRALTDRADEVKVQGTTVAEVLERLVVRYPGLRRHLLTDTGGVRDYVNVFVNEEDTRTLDGVATAVGPGDTITIVPSIAGG